MPSLVRFALQFLLFVPAQIFIFEAVTLYGIATPKPYLLALLFLPQTAAPAAALTAAFLLGITLDVTLFPIGARAFACVLVMGLRDWWVGAVRPQAMSAGEAVQLDRQSLGWLVGYTFPLIALYELAFHILADFGLTWRTLLEAGASAAYTSVLCFLLIILAYRRAGA